MKFTTAAVEGLKPDPARKEYFKFEDGPGAVRGLGVRVQSNGSKHFVFQFRTREGVRRKMTLGDASAVAVAAARDAAREIAAKVARGDDPFADRSRARAAAKAEAEREALSLDVLIERWRDSYLKSKRESYRYEATRALRYAFGEHLKLPAADLSRKAARAVIKGLEDAGRLGQAAVVPLYGSALFRWAIQEEILSENPFTGVKRPAIVERERVLSDPEIAAIWRATASGSPFHNGVRFLLQTGQRLGEVSGMTWSELSPDRAEWNVPAARTKNGKQHCVPLSAAARALLPAQRGADGALVFSTPRGGVVDFHKAKVELDRESGVSNWRLHDLRRTCATRLQSVGVRLEVTESVLNHTSGSRGGLVGLYQRFEYKEEKRVALDAWAARLTAIVEGRDAPSNVVELRASA